MIRRAALLVCGTLGLTLLGCSSSPNQGASPTPAVPGCHTHASTVHLVLSDTQPVPVVRTAPGGCVAVTVPRSPFKATTSESPKVRPTGSLRLVSDTLHADGTRTVYFTAGQTGTATVTSTVAIETKVAVPEWGGVVHIG
jgi:hypothetical protein